MINSLRLYRLHSEWPQSESSLSAQLAQNAFTPCGSFTEQSSGFEPLSNTTDEMLARRLMGVDWIQMRWQTRVLPNAAVNEALQERLAEFSQRLRRDATRKEKRELKDTVYGELLPQALLKSDRILAFYLPRAEVLAVCTSSAKAAELLLDNLRDALGSLQVTPFACARPAKGLLKSVFLGKRGGAFQLGNECRMRDPSDVRASVAWTDMDLRDASVRKHVNDGLYVDRLGILYDNALGCVLDEELVLKKLRFEGLKEVEDDGDEDPLTRQDSEYILQAGVIERLVEDIKKSLGGFAAPGEAARETP